MLLDKISNELAKADKAFSIAKHSAQAVMECAVLDAGIKMENAEYKVMCEAGVDDDTLTAYYEEAEEGLIAKFKSAIDTIIEAIKKFFSDLKDKIISLFEKKEVEQSMEELNKKCRLPFFKSKKVEMPDVSAQEKVFAKFEAKWTELVSKVKAGKSSAEEIREARENWIKEHAVASAAIVTGTVAVAGGLMYKLYKTISGKNKESEAAATKKLDDIRNMKDVSADIKAQLTTLASNISSFYQSKGKHPIETLKTLLRNVKAKVTGKSELEDTNKETGYKYSSSANAEAKDYETESAHDLSLFDSDEFGFMQESTAGNTDGYKSDWFKDIFND